MTYRLVLLAPRIPYTIWYYVAFFFPTLECQRAGCDEKNLLMGKIYQVLYTNVILNILNEKTAEKRSFLYIPDIIDTIFEFSPAFFS